MSDQEIGKSVVISGATKGLGRALALAFGQAGYYVVGLFRADHSSAASMREEFLAEKLDGRFLALDVTRNNPEMIWQTIALPNAGRLTLINNACAAFTPQPMHLLSWEDFQNSFEVAVKGSLFCAQAVMRPMLKARRGTIVNVLTTGVEGPAPKGFAAYVTAKSALQGLTRALASEYSARGIRVFSVSPGFMETALTANWDARLKESILRASPSGAQDPARVAEAVLALVENPRTEGHGENYPIG